MSNPGSITPTRVAAPSQQLAIPSGDSGLARIGDAATDFATSLAHARDQGELVQARLGYSQALDDLHQQFIHDDDPATAPTRFAQAAQDAAAPFYDKLTSADAKNTFALDSGQQAESRRISVMDVSYRRQSDQAVADLDALGDKAARDAAYATNPAERQAAIDNYSASVSGVTESGMLSHADAIKRVDRFKTNLALFDGRSLIDSDPRQAVKLLAKPDYLPDLDPLQRVELQSQAQAKVRQAEREARAANAEARANAAMSLSDLDSTIASGLPVSRAVIDQATADVKASGDPRLANRLNHSIRSAYFADSLRGANPREVEGALAHASDIANKDGADPALAAAVIGGRKFLDTMNRQLGQDPLSFAAQQGVIALAPLQLNGQDQPVAWQNRIRGAQMTAEHYGIEPHYLTAAEAQTVKAALAPSGDPVAKRQVLQMLTAGLGSKVVPELSRMGVSPALMTAGGLMTAGPAHARTAFDIIAGENALTAASKGGDGQSALRPTDTARAASVAGGGHFFGGVTIPQGLPQVMMATSLLSGEGARISAAADALYAQRAQARGFTGKDAAGDGQEIYYRALQEAAGARYEGETQMGGITQYRGRPVLAPSIVAADAFEGVVNHLTAKDLAQASVSGAAPVDANGKPVADDFIRHSFLVSGGNGLYFLSTTDPQGGALSLVRDAKGAPYRLNFNAALTGLQARAAKGAK